MKMNRPLGFLCLVLVASSLLVVAALAQTQNPVTQPLPQEVKTDNSQPRVPTREEVLALVDSVGQLSNKLEQAITPLELDWKLKKGEPGAEIIWQTWTGKEQTVKVTVEQAFSLEAATKHFQTWIWLSSTGLGERFEGLGDEADKRCYDDLPRSQGCAVHVRKGKVRFTFLAEPINKNAGTTLEQLLETAKRFASHALTIDDSAMKTEK
jgi:hypothetical protein